MTIANQLVVPITLWGNKAPTHCISAIHLTRDQKTIVTGCNDGHICIWDVAEQMQITPRCLLFGHTAPVLCFSHGSIATDSTLLVSSSEAGEMSVWDLTDGRCLESAKLPYVHKTIIAYHMYSVNDVRLFCNGYYAEILVMDVLTLDILFTLSSRVNPDWISAVHVLRPVKRQDDVVVALSAAGLVKVWTLNGNESKNEPVYEDESKPIKCFNALKLTCCAYNQRTVLVVCTKYWQIYDAGDFSLLCSYDNPIKERWMGGDFIAADRILMWSDGGKGYLYKLPTNCNASCKDFHTAAKQSDQAFLFCILSFTCDKRLLCPPAMNYFLTTRGSYQKLLLRGDSSGRVIVWNVPDLSERDIEKMRQEKFSKPLEINPVSSLSLEEAWNAMHPSPPAGILDQMYTPGTPGLKLTASVFLPLQGRLVCGREDGCIIIISATQTVLLQLMYGKHQAYEDWPPHQLLHGHNGRVSCLLYPHHVHNHYDIAHLVSGGVDFSVCLWDIYAGTLLHRFCIHAGEITQLLVPPANCNSRVLQSICSVASDHSAALLALKDKKCIMLASRHLFPIQVIKWRPLDDFMIVGCSDGSVYVWQMETGHLDRVVQGLLAEDILRACDENVVSSGDRMTNPAIHFFRGLRHRSLAAIRLAAQRGLHQLHQGPAHMVNTNVIDGTEVQRSRTHPLMIQGLRTNPKDQDSHVLFFDIEALVVQLLSEEYASLSPGQLEVQGLINPSEHQKFLALSSSPETQRKFSGIIARMKDTAENAAQKIQAKAESVGFKTTSGEVTIGRKDSGSGAGSSEAMSKKARQMNLAETNLTMEIAQLLLSLLHAWGLDIELDRVCESKLGLLRPMRPVCFGLLSRGGYMSLLLPTFLHTMKSNINVRVDVQVRNAKHVRVMPPAIPQELIEEEERARRFSSCGHWELGTAITTTHLLAIIALANTLMSMSNATFIPEQERRRKLHRKLSRADSKASNSQPTSPGTPVSTEAKNKDDAAISAEAGAFSSQQAQIKQGWSLLAALHCVLLPDLVKTPCFMSPQVEMLARRWQDRCLEVREAAQALLLAELRRIGPKGRKEVVEEWAPYLPNYGEPYPGNPASLSQFNTATNTNSSTSVSQNVNQSSGVNAIPAGTPSENPQQQVKDEDHSSEEEEEGEHGLDESSARRPSSATEGKRKQATAIVLLGVIGAEYGHEIEISKRKTHTQHTPGDDQKRRSVVVDGFGLSNYSLARHTSQALAFLLLAPPSPLLPAHTSLRRAAIDLIGRGFTVWEPYLDVSKVLLGLLKLCCDSDKLVPSMSYGLPLTPAADSCRTARHALSLIATARPSAFITKLAREVARYNTVAQNAQALNISMNMTILSRSKPEILRVVELLIDKMQADVSDLLVDVMDIVIHCLDHTQLKARGLKETFPAICRFNNVSYCSSTRRIAVGAKDGKLALYDLRASKSQVQNIYAHAEAITACAFSPDGKYLASYSNEENKVCFWQTATGLFGLGNAQTRCVRTYTTPPLNDSVKNNPLKMARLQWTTNKVVILLIGDGSEHRFSVT